jgi:hypothetical protein
LISSWNVFSWFVFWVEFKAKWQIAEGSSQSTTAVGAQGNWEKMKARAELCGITWLMIFGSMPLLVFFFTVAVGINHQKTKNNYPGRRQNENDRFVSPYLANECGGVRIHLF